MINAAIYSFFHLASAVVDSARSLRDDLAIFRLESAIRGSSGVRSRVQIRLAARRRPTVCPTATMHRPRSHRLRRPSNRGRNQGYCSLDRSYDGIAQASGEVT
jgi:hypothetical protein